MTTNHKQAIITTTATAVSEIFRKPYVMPTVKPSNHTARTMNSNCVRNVICTKPYLVVALICYVKCYRTVIIFGKNRRLTIVLEWNRYKEAREGKYYSGIRRKNAQSKDEKI